MKAFLTVAMLLLTFAGAQANEVYKTTDPQGRPVYTDRPPILPAERLNVKSATTDVVEVEKRYDAEMKRYSAEDKAQTEAAKKAADAKQAQALSAEDKAKRCQDARQRYESYMYARRLYEPGQAEGERRYLSSEEIDSARADAKKAMDDLCGGQ